MEENFKPFYWQVPGGRYYTMNYTNCGAKAQPKEPVMTFRNCSKEAPQLRYDNFRNILQRCAGDSVTSVTRTAPPVQASDLGSLRSNNFLDCMVDQASQHLATLNCKGCCSDTSHYNSQTSFGLSRCNCSTAAAAAAAAPVVEHHDSRSSPDEMSSSLTVQHPSEPLDHPFGPSDRFSCCSSSSSAAATATRDVRTAPRGLPTKAGGGGHHRRLIVHPQQQQQEEDEAAAAAAAQSESVMDSILREHFRDTSSEPSSHTPKTARSDHADIHTYNYQPSPRELRDLPMVESAEAVKCGRSNPGPPGSSPSVRQPRLQGSSEQELSALALQLRKTSVDERDYTPIGEFRVDSPKGKQQKISAGARKLGSGGGGGGVQGNPYDLSLSGLSIGEFLVASSTSESRRSSCTPIVMQTGGHLVALTSSCSNNSSMSPALKRKRIRSINNNIDPTGETQRITHIEVERNRRKQMNERLAILLALMPPGFVLKNDQASIIGGAVDFVKELELVLESLQSKKRRRAYAASTLGPSSRRRFHDIISTSAAQQLLSASTAPYHSVGSARTSETFTDVSSHRMVSTEELFQSAQSAARIKLNEVQAECRSAAAAVEVEVLGNDAIVDITTHWRAKQVVRVIVALENLDLTIQHTSVTTRRNIVLYTFNAKVGPRCSMTVHQLAGAIHRNFIGT